MLFRPHFDNIFDLPVCALDPVAQADGSHAAVLVAGPRVHRHWIGVVQQQRLRLRHFFDVFAEVQHRRNAALGIQQAARAERVPDALVHAVLQRNVNIGLKRFQTALTNDA